MDLSLLFRNRLLATGLGTMLALMLHAAFFCLLLAAQPDPDGYAGRRLAAGACTRTAPSLQASSRTWA